MVREDVIRHHELGGVDVAQRHDLGVGWVRVSEEGASFDAEADVAEAHGSSPNGALEGHSRSQGRQRRDTGHGLQEIAAPELLLLRGQVHSAGSFSAEVGRGLRRSHRSSPAMRPVRKARSTATAAASTRFLSTNR